MTTGLLKVTMPSLCVSLRQCDFGEGCGQVRSGAPLFAFRSESHDGVAVLQQNIRDVLITYAIHTFRKIACGFRYANAFHP